VVKGPGGPSGLMGYATGLFGKQIRPAAGTIPLPPNVDDLLWGNVYNGMTVSAESIDGKKEADEKPGSASPLELGGPTSGKPSSSKITAIGYSPADDTSKTSTETPGPIDPRTFRPSGTPKTGTIPEIEKQYKLESARYSTFNTQINNQFGSDEERSDRINSIINEIKEYNKTGVKNLERLTILNNQLDAEIQIATKEQNEKYIKLYNNFKEHHGDSFETEAVKKQLDRLIDSKTNPKDARKLYKTLNDEYNEIKLLSGLTGGKDY
jgi:hypothetical protein